MAAQPQRRLSLDADLVERGIGAAIAIVARARRTTAADEPAEKLAAWVLAMSAELAVQEAAAAMGSPPVRRGDPVTISVSEDAQTAAEIAEGRKETS